MKNLISFCFAFLIMGTNILAQSEEKEVVILVKGSGNSIEIAKQNALRSALEQVYGAFFTAKTEIFNDQVIVDQMISISSGNIKSFKILNEDVLPDGRFSLTIQACLSIEKLSTFVKSKGVEVEFNGGMFALNVKQQILNEEAEMIAISEMVGVLHATMQNSFDFVLDVGNPKSSDDTNQKWTVPLKVTTICNKNLDFCASYFIKNLKSFSLGPAEIDAYRAIGKEVYQITCKYKGVKNVFYLRKKNSFLTIESFMTNMNNYLSNFHISSNDISGKIQTNIERDFNFNQSINSDVLKKCVDFVVPTIPSIMKISDSKLELEFLDLGKKAGETNIYQELKLSEIEKIVGYKVVSGGTNEYGVCGYGGVIMRYPQDVYKLGIRIRKKQFSDDKIAEVLADGPCFKAGIRSGDMILEINYETPQLKTIFEQEIDGQWDTKVDNSTVLIKIKNTSGVKEIKVFPEMGKMAGIVMSMFDIKNVSTREEAIKKCDELTLNGFNDWRAPFGFLEIDCMGYLVRDNLWNFDTGDVGYWSYYKPFKNDFYGLCTYCDGDIWSFKNKRFRDVELLSRPTNVRPVRSFYH